MPVSDLGAVPSLPKISRMCSSCEEKAQAKGLTPDSPVEAPDAVHDVVSRPGRSLDPATRSFFEPRFGQDFGQVRVHTDAEAARSAESIDARAYAVGRHVVFGQGAFAPDTSAGKRLIAHELAHVVQQTGGAAANVVQRDPPQGQPAPKPAPKPSAPKLTCEPCLIDAPSYVPQPTTLTCWAAAAAMVAQVHDQVDYTVEGIMMKADKGGTMYIDQFLKPNRAIPTPTLAVFLSRLGMTLGTPAGFTPKALCDLIKAHGPAAFVLNIGGPITHVVVVYGIENDTTTGECMVNVQDPNPGAGANSSMTFQDFDAQYGGTAGTAVNYFYY